MRPSEHSVPPSQPNPFRHLGGGNSGGDRPVRVQLAVALVIALVLLAVPLYLWRRPKVDDSASAAASMSSEALAVFRPPPDPSKAVVAAALDGGVETDRVKLGRVWIDSCQRAGVRTPAEQCDRQPYCEEALVKAVLSHDCVPKISQGGSVSYALRIDHQKKTYRVFAGKSGSLRRNQALDALSCVQRSIAQPDWDSLPHQHSKYIIAVLATYPPLDSGKP